MAELPTTDCEALEQERQVACRRAPRANTDSCGPVAPLEELRQHDIEVIGGAYGGVELDELAERGVEHRWL